MFDDVAHDDGLAAEVGDACYLTELGGDDFWQACVAWGDVGAEVGCGEDVGIGVGGGGGATGALGGGIDKGGGTGTFPEGG